MRPESFRVQYFRLPRELRDRLGLTETRRRVGTIQTIQLHIYTHKWNVLISDTFRAPHKWLVAHITSGSELLHRSLALHESSPRPYVNAQSSLFSIRDTTSRSLLRAVSRHGICRAMRAAHPLSQITAEGEVEGREKRGVLDY